MPSVFALTITQAIVRGCAHAWTCLADSHVDKRLLFGASYSHTITGYTPLLARTYILFPFAVTNDEDK